MSALFYDLSQDCVGVSFNPVIVPAVVIHCDDVQFKYTVSHELGKD